MQKYIDIDHARAPQSIDNVTVEFVLNITIKVLFIVALIVTTVCAVRFAFLSDDTEVPVIQEEDVLKKYGF